MSMINSTPSFILRNEPYPSQTSENDNGNNSEFNLFDDNPLGENSQGQADLSENENSLSDLFSSDFTFTTTQSDGAPAQNQLTQLAQAAGQSQDIRLPEKDYPDTQKDLINESFDKALQSIDDPDKRQHLETVRDLKLQRVDLNEQLKQAQALSTSAQSNSDTHDPALSEPVDQLTQQIDAVNQQIATEIQEADFTASELSVLAESGAADNYTSLDTKLDQLDDLFSRIQAKHPEMSQGDMVSQLRRSIGKYAEGVWSVAMPFNKGPSELEPEFQKEFLAIRESMEHENGLDLGHVLASMDVAQSADIMLNDAYASWAGDLGSAALETFGTQQGNKPVPMDIGNEKTSAGMTDIMADIDGDNIARHMEKGHELDAMLAYYRNDGQYTNGVVAENRFHSFATDLNLLDDQGNLRSDATDEICDTTMDFILQDNLKESFNQIKDMLLDGKMPEKGSGFILETNLPSLARDASQQFIDILAQGLSSEP